MLQTFVLGTAEERASLMKRVTSRQNPMVVRFRAAARGDSEGLLLLDGAHLVADALDAGIRLREAAVAAGAGSRPDIAALLRRLAEAHVEVIAASPAVMTAISPVKSMSTIVAVADRPMIDGGHMYAGQTPLVLIACDVQDPGNIGAIVRAAEAAGATGIVAAGTCANPFGWKALRGSMGSALRLPIAVEPDVNRAVADARRYGCRVVAAAPRGGRPLFDLDMRTATAVLIGGEGAGLTPALVDGADERVTIPMRPPVESLNAAVTAALVLYEARRQRPERQP